MIYGVIYIFIYLFFMIVCACDVFNMFKCVKICFDDDYMFVDKIWEWLCVLKYDIGIDYLRMILWVLMI
jgi:hypothetical protein